MQNKLNKESIKEKIKEFEAFVGDSLYNECHLDWESEEEYLQAAMESFLDFIYDNEE